MNKFISITSLLLFSTALAGCEKNELHTSELQKNDWTINLENNNYPYKDLLVHFTDETMALTVDTNKLQATSDQLPDTIKNETQKIKNKSKTYKIPYKIKGKNIHLTSDKFKLNDDYIITKGANNIVFTPKNNKRAESLVLRPSQKATVDPAKNNNTYQNILDEYTTKLKEKTPALITEYQNEAHTFIGNNSALADLANKKTSNLIQIANEAVQEMAKVATKDATEYETWANKITLVYADEAQKITESYVETTKQQLEPPKPETPKEEPKSAPQPEAPKQEQPKPATITVQPGDRLTKIAEQAGISAQKLAELNGIIINKNNTLTPPLRVGQVLRTQ